jgi:molybdopterin-containing oxidoreductase family iron-sulfur binding subunit
MVIDLSKCIGCNACTMACGAENNLPVVGPEQAAKGRAMHWIRVDRYEEGPGAFQPVPCMHCEDAPCEKVCPVEATLHNREGLNQMVYNRCVGTRFCANNCPYKVRRFNFLDYTHSEVQEWKMARNPEVTVRSRGVMEKCTYCTQRIEAADQRARIQEREIADGEVVTACQAACPTGAIVFGDLSEPGSEVARLASMPHNYGLLTELNTRPRTTYLARLRQSEEEAT